MRKQLFALSMGIMFLLIYTHVLAQPYDNLQNLSRPMIIFGTTEAYPPFASVDASGKHVYGFSIAFSQLLCQELKVRCVYKPMFLKDFFSELQNNSIDAAIGAIEITPEREKKFAFTLPYLPSIGIIMANLQKSQPRIKKMTYEVAKNKVFGLQTDSAFTEFLLNMFPSIQFKTFDSEGALIEALAKNKVDFIVVQKAVADFWINQADNNFYTIERPFNLHLGIGIMLNKNNPELLNQLNAAILKVTQKKEFIQLLETFFPDT